VRDAVAFLTRLPVGSGRLSPGAAVFFPVVGAALGALVGVVARNDFVPPLVAAALAVALELVVTGALHVDGLADSADGLAGRDREHALAIMRDHSLGAYGASALTLDLVAKTAALASTDDVVAVIAAFALSRAAPLPLAAALPYARADGTGRVLDRLPLWTAAPGVALALGVGVLAPAAIAAAVLVTAGVWWLARRRLQGVTGDVMGAAVELTATAALIAVLGT
jgi:adenosylcobinamide-GDP ribazoletransferase